MLASEPKYKVYTIEEYTQYVLDDPRVSAFIAKFALYQKAADKVIDAFEGLVDSGVLTFDSTEELEQARAFNLSTEECKTAELERLVETLHKDIGWYDALELTFDDIAARDASLPHPNKTDMPALIFREFATNAEFKDYLFKGSVELLSGAYFAKDVDLARQRYLVFAAFLWTYMDKKTPEGGGDQYYSYAECCATLPIENGIVNAQYGGGIANLSGLLLPRSKKIPTKPHHARFNRAMATEEIDATKISYQSIRSDFLREFKDYIHFDMWGHDDYDKKQKKGTVLRLDLDTPDPGSVVVQTCGDSTPICNTTYLINEDTLPRLREQYLSPNTALTKLATCLRCNHCAKKAYFKASLNSQNQYYCDLRCFNRCK